MNATHNYTVTAKMVGSRDGIEVNVQAANAREAVKKAKFQLYDVESIFCSADGKVEFKAQRNA